MNTVYPKQALDRLVRLNPSRDSAMLGTRPLPPKPVSLIGGVLSWEEPKQTENVTHYKIYLGAGLLFAKVPVGQKRIAGIPETKVFITSYDSRVDGESYELSVTGTQAPLPDSVVSLATFGAIGDAIEIPGVVSMSSGSPALATSDARFLAEDVGKTICVLGAGAAGADLITTIKAFGSSGSVTLGANSSANISAGNAIFGTNNNVAIAAAIAFAQPTAGVRRYSGVFIPAGRYLTTQTVENSTSFEWTGVGVDNQAASMFVYVGSGVGWLMHSADDTAWESGAGGSTPVFAINVRNVGIACYGGCTDAIQIRNLSQGIFHRLTTNDSAFASSQCCVRLVNPNLLTFTEPIWVGGNLVAAASCLAIESTGFPRDATTVRIVGGNLFRAGVTFDVGANLTCLQVTGGTHVEEFQTLIKLDNTLYHSVPLQLEQCVFEDMEILGNLNLFPSGALIIDAVANGNFSYALRELHFRRNRIFYVASQKNPIRFNIDNAITPDINVTLRDNTWSNVDTSLVRCDGTHSNAILLTAENNIKVFGSAFALIDTASGGVTPSLQIPAYGGEAIDDTQTLVRTNAGRVAKADASGVGCTPGTTGVLWFDNSLRVQADPLTGAGQFYISDEAFARVVELVVPTTTFTAIWNFLGSLGAFAFRGNIAIGPGVPVDPANTLHVQDAAGHTSVLIEPGASDTSGSPLLTISTSSGLIQFFAGGTAAFAGSVRNDALSASSPVRTDSGKNLTSGQTSLTSSTDISGAGLTTGHLIKWSGSACADAGAPVVLPVHESDVTNLVSDLASLSSRITTIENAFAAALNGTFNAGTDPNITVSSGLITSVGP